MLERQGNVFLLLILEDKCTVLFLYFSVFVAGDLHVGGSFSVRT